MEPNRFTRKLALLRGKRQAAVPRAQYYLAAARRERSARKLRLHLRRMQPVVLITPRWSRPDRFLDDIATDLAIGRPDIQARCLSVASLGGRTAHHTWTWLVSAIVEFTDVRLDGPVHQAVDRHGFRHVMMQAFARANHGPKRALLIHGMENLTLEIRQDLVSVFEAYVQDTRPSQRRFNLLVAGSVDSAQFRVDGAVRERLPDFDVREAVEALVEYTGPGQRDELAEAARRLGGVPALIDALGTELERTRTVPTNTDALWSALGLIGDEVRAALEIASSKPALAERLEDIGRALEPMVYSGSLTDDALLGAGLITLRGGMTPTLSVRAPLFTGQVAVVEPIST